MCSILGGIDAKTMRKWVWPYIGSMFELKYDVVSTILYGTCLCIHDVMICVRYVLLHTHTIPDSF